MKAAGLLFESMLGEARLLLHKVRRRALESILSSGLLIGVFLLMLFGVGLGSHLPGVPGAEQLAIGFVTWRFATAAYGSIAVEVADDINARCLEQLAIGGGLLRVYLLRAAVHLIAGSVGTLFMLLVVAVLVDASLLTHAGALLVLLWIGAPALMGLGLVVGAVNVAFKQADTLNALMLMSVIALVTLPGQPFGLWSALPFVYPASLARALIEVCPPGVSALIVAAALSLAWFAAGCCVFRAAATTARRRGTLSHH